MQGRFLRARERRALPDLVEIGEDLQGAVLSLAVNYVDYLDGYS